VSIVSVFQVAEKDKAPGADANKLGSGEKRKAEDGEPNKDLKKVGEAASLSYDGNFLSVTLK
jgi:hypothetical protein